jgi:hypothetical protein
MQTEVQYTAVPKSHQITIKADIAVIAAVTIEDQSFSMIQAYGLNDMNGHADLYLTAESLACRVNLNGMCW